MTALADRAAAAPVDDDPEVVARRRRWWRPSRPTHRARQTRQPTIRKPLSMRRIVASVVLFTLCGLVLWSAFFLSVVSKASEARAQHLLYARFRNQLALAIAPTGGDIPAGTPVALLNAPSAGIHGVVVVEGTSSNVTRSGPGHLRTSPLPGQVGDSVIYGRSLTYGAPFAAIGSLKPGDVIKATTDLGVFNYKVTGVRHKGDQWQPPQNGQSGITLVSIQGGWIPNRVVYVDALLEGKTAQTPGGRPAELEAGDQLLANDHSAVALIEIVLWLELLVILVCAVTWLRTRWNGWQTWVVAVPILLASLWGLSLSASNLLPNVV